ncbi:hypothetical protein NAV33_03120 [Pseudomonas stutzeri]|uniref:hypothetical protein n=1 Tax=Stutzerimonas stutzeri TaxID=316 RepID=UPI00210D5926|nr:hypothetical protein [Stutzerimonas stutzeri]MCQ4310892.1 hypothetical protein [Stutzerimonas stutzeri]
MQLLRNRADWCNWAEGLAGISIRHNYNVPAEPATYPCFAYAVAECLLGEVEAPRYLMGSELCEMMAALLEAHP